MGCAGNIWLAHVTTFQKKLQNVSFDRKSFPGGWISRNMAANVNIMFASVSIWSVLRRLPVRNELQWHDSPPKKENYSGTKVFSVFIPLANGQQLGQEYGSNNLNDSVCKFLIDLPPFTLAMSETLNCKLGTVSEWVNVMGPIRQCASAAGTLPHNLELT